VIEALVAIAPALRGEKFPGVLVTCGFLTPSGNIACNVGRFGPGAKGPGFLLSRARQATF
jgi:hypothetical protein